MIGIIDFIVKNLNGLSIDVHKILEFIVISFFLCVLSYLHLNLLSSFYKFKFSKKQEKLFLVVLSLVQILSKLLFQSLSQKLIILCIIPILLYLVFRIDRSHALIFTSIIGTMMIVSERLIDSIYSGFKFDASNFLQDISVLTVNFLIEIIFIILFQKKKNRINTESYQLDNWKSTIITILFFIIVIFLIVKDEYFQGLGSLYTILNNSVILIFYLMMTLINIHERIEEKLENQEIETLKIHNKTLSLCIQNIKNFKNDFNSIMQDVGGYIKYNDFESLKNYYNEMMEEYKDVKNLSILSPTTINELAIYNIISNKYYLAKKQGIEIEIEIVMDFSKLEIKAYELSRILGILIDNAIEATSVCEKKLISIIFREGRREDIIKISNTYSEHDMDINKIFEKGFSTKKDNRGLGLWEVKQILEKHTNLDLYTHKEQNIFWQELSIYHSK